MLQAQHGGVHDDGDHAQLLDAGHGLHRLLQRLLLLHIRREDVIAARTPVRYTPERRRHRLFVIRRRHCSSQHASLRPSLCRPDLPQHSAWQVSTRRIPGFTQDVPSLPGYHRDYPEVMLNKLNTLWTEVNLRASDRRLSFHLKASPCNE